MVSVTQQERSTTIKQGGTVKQREVEPAFEHMLKQAAPPVAHRE